MTRLKPEIFKQKKAIYDKNIVWIRNQLDVTFVLSFISPLQVAEHVSGSSSAPEDGHMVARNMLSNLYGRNKG